MIDTSLAPTNHLIALARTAARLPNAVLVVALAVLIIVVAQIPALLGLLTIELLFGFDPRSLPDSAVLSGLLTGLGLIVAFLPIYLLLWLWLRWYERRPFWTLGFEPAGALRKWLRGALTGLLMFGGTVGLMALGGSLTLETGPAHLQGLPALPGALLLLPGWIVQGGAEEVLTRGWMLPVLAARYRLWIGVLVSSVFFAAVHSANPNLQPLAILNLALFGLFSACYALREGGLWGVCANHAIWNWAQGNLFGLEVSGVQPPGGTLINLKESGPDLLTGGPFGPEGGLAVTAVVVGAIAVLILPWSGRARVSPRGAGNEATGT